MRRLAGFGGVLSLFFLWTATIGAAADPQKSLEDTVLKFYEAYVQGRWKTAEQYIEPESRDAFRAEPRSAIGKYQIQKVELKEGGQSAIVTVAVDMPVEALGGQVMSLNALSRWRFSNGKWRMVLGAPPPYPAASSTGNLPSTSAPPTPDLKFDFTEFDFGIKRQGDVVKIEFPFVNVTDHPVQVTASLVSSCNCIEVGVNKETVAPGEKAAVTFTLRSDPFTFNYHQGIGVKVQPGGGNAILDITGFLNPADQNPPAK